MPNDYFRFKKFVIYQDKCSMKVCTDACILGAWIAEKAANGNLQATTCLDIGAGTGLLSLMLAQKFSAAIEAIEIENNAFAQLQNNFNISEWNDRLFTIPGDVKNFIFNKTYDLIISNPPFYENDLLSAQQTKNIAKHNEQLTLEDLASVVQNILHFEGNFIVLLPYHRLNYFEDLATKKNFFLQEKLLIRPTLKHDYFRGILWFSKKKNSSPDIKELIIKQENQVYTDELVKLMRDYYLAL